jgi:hypothetical protein
MWQRMKSGSKSGFDKGWKALDKLGAPVNRLSNKLGSEAFWPTTLGTPTFTIEIYNARRAEWLNTRTKCVGHR